tara:strand:- start:110 stop:1297 length:1188 start_codon:yes stop_codon:yes gene_type:complete
MITRQMRVQLVEEAGLSEAEIRKLTPEEAHKVIEKATGGIPKVTQSSLKTSNMSKTPNTTSTASTASTSSTAQSTPPPQPTQPTGPKQPGSSASASAPPTSMAGPLFGGLFGGGLALAGASYYFFGSGAEENEDSALNTVVRMVRGTKDDENAHAGEDLSLEEYEKMQAQNKQSFSKTLNDMKGLHTKSGAEHGTETNEWSGNDGTVDSGSDSATTIQEPRKMTMMEKLEAAKRRGATAGVSADTLKRMPVQKPAWMVEEEQKRKGPGMGGTTTDTVEGSTVDNNSEGSIAVVVDAEQSVAEEKTLPTAKDVNLMDVEPQVERTREEKLIAGLESMLTRQREREQEYISLHNLRGRTSIFGRPSVIQNAQHQTILDGFKKEKQRIKQNIKDVRKR